MAAKFFLDDQARLYRCSEVVFNIIFCNEKVAVISLLNIKGEKEKTSANTGYDVYSSLRSLQRVAKPLASIKMTVQEYILNKDLFDENDRDIVGILWEDENIEPIDKIKISFELFERSPEYGICMELKMAFNEMSIEIRDYLWEKYRYYLLSGTDKQKEQIKYSLWVDFFEDPETVDEAWSKIVTNNSEINVLRQVLSISGPVPFEKKDKLYLKVIED